MRRFAKGPKDVVGLDLASDSVKAVRLRRTQDSIQILAADFLHGIDPANPQPIVVPKPLRAPYAALATAGNKAVVKLLNMPGRFGERDEAALPANLGVPPDDSHRLAYSILSSGQARNETRVLAVAIPEQDALTAIAMLPRGRPAPYDLQLSGLAALVGFSFGPGEALLEQTVGVLDGSENVTTFAIFHKGMLALLRRFDFGEATVTAKIAERLGVDGKTVQGFMADSSFDVSAILQRSLETFFRQALISKEFVERRENCRLSEVLVSGSLSALRGMREVIQHFMGLEVRNWNPFNGLATVAPQALPDSVSGQEPRFASAFGAAMGVLMESE